ncbi:MAG: hypothetical protein ACXAEX_08610 [Promethearchaeota archaeon]|jgi:hypothetical protein
MVNYEGALRKSELVYILRKDIIINGKEANLWVGESKTTKRNIYVWESIPYLNEYFALNNFKPTDKIFNYNPDSINVLYNRLAPENPRC